MADLTMVDLLPAPDLLSPPDLSMCTANAFRGCTGATAHFCGASGTGDVAIDCGAGGCAGPDHCNQCAQPSTVTCSGSTQNVCDQYGRLTATSCALGCTATAADTDLGTAASAHCNTVVPSNGFVLDCVTRGATYDLSVASGSSTLDPDTGLRDGSALPAGVYDAAKKSFHLRSLSIAAGATLVGKPAALSPLVLLVDLDVQIQGTLDVAAHLTTATTSVAGPGASTVDGAGTAGRAVGGTVGTRGTGAGGASYGSLGADGARTTGSGGFAGSIYPAATVAVPDITSLVPLQGGGTGGPPSGSATSKAGGGGAVQISACGDIAVGASGLINAGGSGGPRSLAVSTYAGGAGGGSGGGILLEAKTVAVTGTLAAAGGGGAGGAVGAPSNVHGEAGLDARTTSCVGNGGAGASGANGGLGGAGGGGACAIDVLMPVVASSGTTGTVVGIDTLVGHGGGGGGGGRIRINTQSGAAMIGAQSINPNTALNYALGTVALQ